MIRNYRLCVFCAVAAAVIVLLLGLPGSVRAADSVSFIKDVAPILKENCFACHDAKKKAGKYDMSTFEKLMAGGDNGAVILPGKVSESEFHNLMVTDDARRMPPRDKGSAVSKSKTEIVRRWIAEGAKLDAGLDAKADLVAELRRRWTPPSPPDSFKLPIPVSALAFDKNLLVVGGYHELTVWDYTTGKLLKRIRTRAERTYGLSFLPDGTLAVAGGRPGQEGDVRLYNLSVAGEILDGVANDKVMIKHLFDGDDSILCLALSPDGRKLAAGGTDRLVRVWDVSNPLSAKLEATIENHADWVLGLTFTSDGKFLYTASRDRTAKVWDLTRKESIFTMPEHQAVVYGVTARTDGSFGFSVGADKMLRVWKPSADSKAIKTTGVHPDEVLRVVMHPTKNVIFTACADKVVRSWEGIEKFPLLKRFEGASDIIYALAVNSDGSLVAAGTHTGEVRVWKSDDASLVKSFNATPGLRLPAATK